MSKNKKIIINIMPRSKGSTDLLLPDFNKLERPSTPYTTTYKTDGITHNTQGRMWSNDIYNEDGSLIIDSTGFKDTFVGWWLQKHVIDIYAKNCISLPQASPKEQFSHEIYQVEVEVKVDYSGCINMNTNYNEL
jgi:hypothetical protein